MASMPDLIFTVLFFFMIVTHMRTETPRLKFDTPQGKELSDPRDKYEMVNLYIGKDNEGNYLLQVGDDIVSMEQLGQAIRHARGKARTVPTEEPEGEAGAPQNTVINIRADRETPMGFITDVKQTLRRNGFLSIRYNATEKKKEDEKPQEE